MILGEAQASVEMAMKQRHKARNCFTGIGFTRKFIAEDASTKSILREDYFFFASDRVEE